MSRLNLENNMKRRSCCNAESKETLHEFGEALDLLEEYEHPDLYEYEQEHPDVYAELGGTREHEIIGSDSRLRVTDTTAAPFRYICNFEYDFPGIGPRAMCSGTLIGPRSVLTAGHCIAGKEPSRMRVIPGRNGLLEPLPATQAAKFILALGYRESSPTDYGIIHLRHPVGNSIGYWSRAYSRAAGDTIGTSISANPLPLPAGTLKVNVSGYPADKPSDSRFGCRDLTRPRQRCFHSVLSDSRRQRVCGTCQYRAYDRTVSLSGGMLHYLNDTCPGHSGSPIWVRRHPSMGGRVLVGIHVAGDDPATPGVSNRAVHINSTILAFIIANTI
jgi:glutamyl endopeptidase